MPRRPKQDEPDELRRRLIGLLEEFEGELRTGDLRERVRALIPAYHLLRDLGSSLVPSGLATSARERILAYFIKYPMTALDGEELMVVSGIGEYARRVRELRVQFGWRIASGVTLKAMADEDEDALTELGLPQLQPDDYVLLDTQQDREAAHRWNIANTIRRSRASVRDKLLRYFRENIGSEITGEELRYVAGNKTEWARRTRELRTEHGWPIVTKTTGRPDLPVGVYVLEADQQLPEHDRHIPDAVRREVLRRDSYACQMCHWSHELWNPSDPRHLEAHHRLAHRDKGGNVPENLETLCNVCHDRVHSS